MAGFRLLILAVILFSLNSSLFSQTYSIKGQFWASGEFIENQSDFMPQLGYIPTLSAYYELSRGKMVDLEWAYRFGRSYIGDSEEHYEKPYRGWLRYSTQHIEARLGLQKISFGPARVLRPLAWFDTIDPEDPIAQTEGVEAFRLQFFPSNSLVLWTWIMKDVSDTLSYGGRGELSTRLGEWGFTLHQDTDVSNTQVGIDFRYDGFIGFWNESVMIKSDNTEINLITMGVDYTLPIASGVLIMTESMFISRKQNTTTAFMVSLPVGMFHNVMLISSFDWDENNTYNYLRLSSTYDNFSINCMASINPNEVSNNFQLMFIYNH